MSHNINSLVPPKSEIFNNLPNAGKLYIALRETGIDNYMAICDIIDNSIEAMASEIRIHCQRNNGEDQIIISDNGIGMDEDTLSEATRLGSDTNQENYKLKKYGVGLCLSSMSIGRRFEILTRKENDQCLYACHDLDLIIKSNDFVVERRVATSDEIINANFFYSTGTTVILTKNDRISDGNLTQWSDTLRKRVSRVFRNYIGKYSNIKIYINNKLVEPLSPLELNDKDTKVFYSETLSFKSYPIRIKMVKIPDHKSIDIEMNLRNQGFYVMREGREIDAAVTLGIYSKHPNLNFFRAEIDFPKQLDDHFRVNMQKHNVTPSQSLSDFLKMELKKQIDQMLRDVQREKRNQIQENSNLIDLDLIEKRFNLVASSLITPLLKKEKRDKSNENTPPVNSIKEDPKKTRIRTPIKVDRIGSFNIKIEKVNLGSEGRYATWLSRGSTLVISFNIDHTFCQRILLSQSLEVVDATAYFIIIDIISKSKVFSDQNNDEVLAIIDDMQNEISHNLLVIDDIIS